jgi:hypothetical protein
VDGHPVDPDGVLKSELATGLALGDALPLLFSTARTGRLSARESDGPALDVWVEHGRVMHAAWGPLRALGALEMAALLPPRADFLFADGERSQNQTLDLSAIDVAARLAEVSRAGGKLVGAIPRMQAVPHLTGQKPRGIDPDATRVLDEIDGTRSVADLTVGRQPLAVVRALASLVGQGAVSFEAAAPPPPPVEIPASVMPTPVEIPASVMPTPVEIPTSVAADTPEAETPEAETPEADKPEVVPPQIATGQAETRQVEAPPRRRIPVNVGLAALALALAVVTWVAVQRMQPDDSSAGAQATAVPTVAPVVVAAPPVATPAAVPTEAPPTLAPTVAATAPPPTAVPTLAPTVPVVTAAPPASVPLVDETFASGAAGWPDAATSAAFWDTAGYHLVPRIAGQYVAITAPTGPPVADGAVTGLFRKLAGPVGGGYGLILRAQAPLDGSNQGGRYYVFEVGDRGEVGAWRREQDQWVDLLPWKPSDVVHAGAAENRLEVRAAGPQFTFSVNDAPVAQVTDATLPSGAVGVFTGGDGNQVVLERFTVFP